MNNSVTVKSEKPLKPTNRVETLSSRNLFKGGRELVIEHEGAQYFLRRTHANKLILTK